MLTVSRATAVARGAVLRAFNKERGPRRYARTSYGILRTEQYDLFPEHREAKKTRDRHDGKFNVVNTIDWLLKLVTQITLSFRPLTLLLCNVLDADV